MWVERQRTDRCEAEGVAIRRCFGNQVHTKGSTCAWFVFNDDRLSKHNGQAFGHDAHNAVADAGSWIGDDDFNGFVWPVGGLSLCGQGKERGKSQAKQAAS